MKQHEKLASEESKTLKNEEFTSKNDGIKPLDLKSCIRRRSKTLIKPSNNNAENLEKISNFDEKNTDKNEEAGEYYGKRPLQMNYMSLDAKEKKILEFLDNERVEWGDPAEKTYAYYNNMKKKLIIFWFVLCIEIIIIRHAHNIFSSSDIYALFHMAVVHNILHRYD